MTDKMIKLNLNIFMLHMYVHKMIRDVLEIQLIREVKNDFFLTFSFFFSEKKFLL